MLPQPALAEVVELLLEELMLDEEELELELELEAELAWLLDALELTELDALLLELDLLLLDTDDIDDDIDDMDMLLALVMLELLTATLEALLLNDEADKELDEIALLALLTELLT